LTLCEIEVAAAPILAGFRTPRGDLEKLVVHELVVLTDFELTEHKTVAKFDHRHHDGGQICPVRQQQEVDLIDVD